MKKILLLILTIWGGTAIAQTTGYLRYDTIRAQRPGRNSELIIENSTRDSVGAVLTNVGGGLTRFVRLSASSGSDSLTISSSVCVDTFRSWLNGTGRIAGIVNRCEIPYSGGVVTLIDTTTFNVTAAINYNIYGNLGSSPDSVVTLATPDTLGRFDIIAVDTFNQVVVITGEVGEYPSYPFLDIETQKALAFVYVRDDSIALSVTPLDTTNIWSRNVTHIYANVVANTGIGTVSPTAKLEVVTSTNLLNGSTLRNPTIPSLQSQNQSSPAFNLLAVARDSANNINRNTGFRMFAGTYNGTANPPTSTLFFAPVHGTATPLRLESNGGATIAGFQLETTGLLTRFAGGIQYRGVTAGNQHLFQNISGALPAGISMFTIDHFSSTSGLLTRSLSVSGDRQQRVFDVYTEGIAAISNATFPTTSRKAAFQVESVGRGVIFPRMNTLQRTNMVRRVATVTLTGGGSGMTKPLLPRVTVPSTGLPAYIRPTVVGGIITALTLDFGGSDAPAVGGNLVFDTTGSTTGGPFALPTGTFTVATDTMPTAMMVYNIDSGCYQSYNHLTAAWINMREGAGGGGGGAGTLQQVTDAGNSTTDTLLLDGATFGYDATYATIKIGVNAGSNLTGSPDNRNNIAIGSSAGIAVQANDNIAIGRDAMPSAGEQTNANVIAIGQEAGGGVGAHTINLGYGANTDSSNQLAIGTGIGGGFNMRLGFGNLTTSRKQHFQDKEGNIALTQDISDTNFMRDVVVISPLVASSSATTDTIQMVYKSYVAILYQTGTDAPVANVLQNSLGGTVVWSRTNAGDYRATLTGAFTANKTAIICDKAKMNADDLTGLRYFWALRNDDDSIKLVSGTDGLPADDTLTEYVIEIRVYR